MKPFLWSLLLVLWSSCGLATTTLLLLLSVGGVSSFSVHPTTTTRAPRTATRRQSPTVLFSIEDAIRELQQMEQFANNKDNDVVERFSLQENFDRWRFLQNLLDGELDSADVNEVLYRVLQGYISSNNRDSRQVEEGSSPRITDELKETIQGLLEDRSDAIAALQDPDCSPGDKHVLETLESLLPDPQENEDAHKGAWDTVMELHGRESVKLNEISQSQQWQAVCLVARVLIYYDFLATGIME